MASTTTLKLSVKVKARIARLAKESGRSAHSLMVEALGREVAREGRLQEFVREALASDAATKEGAAVYAAEDVHSWLERLAQNPKATRPKAWRRESIQRTHSPIWSMHLLFLRNTTRARQ